MASKFEGLPMVILEAQQMGVVPIVMDSFSAVHDIIEDKVNGFIVPNNSIVKMRQRLRSLMLNQAMLKEKALNGMETVKRFSVEHVVSMWEQLFQDMSLRSK